MTDDDLRPGSVTSGRLTVRGSDGCAGVYHLADGDDTLTADELRIETPAGVVRVVADGDALAIDTVEE